MKFVIEYHFAPSTYLAGLKRFAETQGPPPAGITMLGRWHSAAGHKGYGLAETTDAKALYAWVLDWADLLSVEVHPVLEDAEFAEVITAHFKQ
ncbi:MAG TPA: DUF3303 family protein [Blastocatellia bacterium]|nr:DUF3303 family protein [Blastocatellia bacterium]